MDIQTELHKTHPDYVVYVPKSADCSTGDTGNEHFLESPPYSPRLIPKRLLLE